MSVMIDDQLDALADFRGAVIRPADNTYADVARTAVAFGSPALVLRPADTLDVQRAVRFAAATDLPIAVRGGGHSFAGLGTIDNGIVIDLGNLHGINVRNGGRVQVGGGAVWRQVAEALAPHGLAISSGDTGSVGVGGLTLSGGIGWTARRDGLALDHLRAVEIVTASGDLVRVDAEQHPDLFWAVRGGGGGFGIVTGFEFQACPVGEIHFGAITFPATEVADVLPGWVRWMRTAPDSISSTVGLANPFLGGRDAPIKITIAATDPATAEAAVRTLHSFGTVVSEDVQLRPYADILEPGAMVPPMLRFAVRSGFVAPTGVEGMTDALVRIAAQEQPAAISVHALGGAVGRVPAADTAFAHRDAALLVTTFAAAPASQLAAVREQMAGIWHELSPHTSGAYANFLDGSEPAATAAVHPGPARERLAAVRRRYDPAGVFSREARTTDAVASSATTEVAGE